MTSGDASLRPRARIGRTLALAGLLGLVGAFATMLTASAASVTVTSDRIVLKSGRELVGQVESEADHQVRFLDEQRGLIVLSRRHIRTIVRGDAPPDAFAPLILDGPDDAAPKSYVRYDAPSADAPGHLLTGVARFFHEPTRTTVFLVGAVHIGEIDYYARLQDLLDSCDEVLFEGVGPGAGQAPPSDEELGRMDALLKLQLMLKDALGLTFQKDGLDYHHAAWRNADVDFGSLSRRMQEKGVQLPTDSPLMQALIRLAVGTFDLSTAKANPGLQRMLKRQAAAAMMMADTLLGSDGAQKALGEVLVDWRNDAALAVLDEELREGAKGRWIAIFYGAAHLPDLAAKLAARGLEYQRSTFVPAWTIE